MAMKRPSLAMLALGVGTGIFGGCAAASPRAGMDDVERMINTRNQTSVHWREGPDQNAQAAESVKQMLHGSLVVETAVRVGLVNNPSLRARLEEIGIAQADLRQAGLLANPKLHAFMWFPTGGNNSQAGRELGVSENFLDVLVLPLRKKLARTQFEQAKLRLSYDVLSLTAEIKSAFYAVQGAQKRLELQNAFVESLKTAADLAERQRQAGNISRLDLDREQAAYHQAELDLIQAESDMTADHERLALLLGLQNQDDWHVEGTFPDISTAAPSLGDLEAAALSQRWDLAAAREEPSVLQEALKINRLGIFGDVEVGVDSEREIDGLLGIGPSASLDLPIFDRKQASNARLKSQILQSRYGVTALENQIRFEVRLARNALLTAQRRAEDYRVRLVPLRQNIADESLSYYNFMLFGVFQLLQAKQDELTAERGYVAALRDYWIADAELERAVGGPIAQAGAGEKP